MKEETSGVVTLQVERLADVLKVLGEPTRLRLLAMLRAGSCCVCELQAGLPISQPAVSQHLRRLKSAGLVTEERRGQWVYYALEEKAYAFLPAILQLLPNEVAKGNLALACAEEGEGMLPVENRIEKASV